MKKIRSSKIYMVWYNRENGIWFIGYTGVKTVPLSMSMSIQEDQVIDMKKLRKENTEIVAACITVWYTVTPDFSPERRNYRLGERTVWKVMLLRGGNAQARDVCPYCPPAVTEELLY